MLVNMYDVRVSCYVWSMSRIIFIRHNEHDFLVLRLRNNGLEVVKGGLDLLTNFSLSLFLFLVLVPLYTRLITKPDTKTEWSYTSSEKLQHQLIHVNLDNDDTWKVQTNDFQGLLF